MNCQEGKSNSQNQALKKLAWGMLFSEWEEIFRDLRQPAFRVRQVWEWLYLRKVHSFAEMTNLPAALRSQLEERVDLASWKTDDFVEAGDGVRKLLLECRDGEKIESVIIPARDRSTVCVSTQAGCGFGCIFCATGKCGFVRNLEAGEIVGQFMAALEAAPMRLTNVVFMGMGEPFANYDNVLKAIRILNDANGLAIGARRLTLSTCGVVPGIKRLSEEGLQVELSVSLHAPNDELRNELMPVNKSWPLSELMEACREYTEKTGRIITFEYTLVEGVNDSLAHAAELIDIVRPVRGRVNLIPLSPVEHYSGTTPSPEACAKFARKLERAGVNVTLRRSKGSGVAAACGQLKLNRSKQQ